MFGVCQVMLANVRAGACSLFVADVALPYMMTRDLHGSDIYSSCHVAVATKAGTYHTFKTIWALVNTSCTTWRTVVPINLQCTHGSNLPVRCVITLILIQIISDHMFRVMPGHWS